MNVVFRLVAHPTRLRNVHLSFVSFALFFVFLFADSGRFILEGADNPGIVHKVTSVLSQNGLSIDKMETSDEIAPYGGTTLFKMRGIAHAYEPIAAGFDAEKVRDELSSLGNALNCDIDLEEVDSDELEAYAS